MSAFSNRVLQGHVIDALRQLPDESVHMVVTSPPYWGLRAYGTPPTLWGGKSDCSHAWKTLWAPPTKNATQGSTETNKYPALVKAMPKPNPSLLCESCGAWSGDFGSESVHDCLAWARREPPCSLCFVCHVRAVGREIHRVLRSDGTFWLNIADCYAGSMKGTGADGKAYAGKKQSTNEGSVGVPVQDWKKLGLKRKDIVGIPERVALALQSDGWWWRSREIWLKVNQFPETVLDRTTRCFEPVFMFTKQEDYFFDAYAIREAVTGSEHSRAMGLLPTAKVHGENGPSSVEYRNKRNVWVIPTAGYEEAHFATFAPDMVAIPILAGTSEKGCCPKCSAPWERQIEPTPEYQAVLEANRGSNHVVPERNDDNNIGSRGQARTRNSGLAPSYVEVGWEPTCKCYDKGEVPRDANLTRGIVLDPFFGSGTTGLVAVMCKRDYIGIELGEQYVTMAKDRIAREVAQPGLF